jgi:hypothetical protein
VKLDIEGGEWDIFLNDEIDWSNVDTLMMEWHTNYLKDESNEKMGKVVEMLKRDFKTVTTQLNVMSYGKVAAMLVRAFK